MEIESGTCPDGLATRVPRTCGRKLCFLAKMIRRILALGFWVVCWITHWFMFLLKRKFVFEPQNYRAINLITQLFQSGRAIFESMSNTSFGTLCVRRRSIRSPQTLRSSLRGTVLRAFLDQRPKCGFQNRRVRITCARCFRQGRLGACLE